MALRIDTLLDRKRMGKELTAHTDTSCGLSDG